jgi:sulfur carrier protein
MEIQLNNQAREIASGATVQQLLDECVGAEQNGIAVAVNNSVVPKAQWDVYQLQASDKMIIIRATQGG